MICSVDGCGRRTEAKGLCDKHYKRQYRHGSPLALKRREKGTGTISQGYIVRKENGEKKPEHVRIAERALGHALPAGALVHHADCNRSNNERSNLVICPSQAYHYLLHVRMRALDACGNPDWRRCHYCKTYDSQENLREREGRHHHLNCKNLYQQNYRTRVLP